MGQVAVVDGKLAQISTSPDVLQVKGWSAVAGGTTSVVVIPRNVTYHRMWLRLIKADGTTLLSDAEIAAAIAKVRLIVDGVKFIENPASDLTMLYDHYYGRIKPLTANKGFLPIIIDRNYLPGVTAEESTGLGTKDLTNLSLEFDQAAGGLAATAELWCEVGPNDNVGRMVRLYNFSQNGVAAGELDLFAGNGLPIDASKTLLALHIKKTTVTNLTVKPDGITSLIDQVPIEVWNAMMEHYSLKEQSGAGFTNLTLARRWRLLDGLNLGSNAFRVTPKYSANPGNIPMIAEIVENA